MRETLANSNDAPQSYVDALHRLCDAAQALDRHLMLVAGGESSAYADLPAPLRSAISAKLQRASEFFSTVVCRWVLGDVAVLLDKHGVLSALRRLGPPLTSWLMLKMFFPYSHPSSQTVWGVRCRISRSIFGSFFPFSLLSSSFAHGLQESL